MAASQFKIGSGFHLHNFPWSHHSPCRLYTRRVSSFFSFHHLFLSGAHRRQTISPEVPGPSLVTPAAPLTWPDTWGAEALLQHLPGHCLEASQLPRRRGRGEPGEEDSELLEPHHGTQAQLGGSKTQQWQVVHIPEVGPPAASRSAASREEGHSDGGHCTW